MGRRGARGLRLAALVAGLAACAGPSAAAHAAPARSGASPGGVLVDFGQPQPIPRSMLGFIHSLGPTHPTNELLAPLRPGLWRGRLGTADRQRARAAGGRYQIVLSDYWGAYPKDHAVWRDAPYDDLVRWEGFVRAIANRMRGLDVVWDVWNEPDSHHYWRGSRAQFFETYAVAARTIRSVLGPGATIGGPSLERYDLDYMRGLLDHCAGDDPEASSEPRCPVNILSWHELESTAPTPVVAHHLREARTQLVDDPRYAGIGLREIFVNENLSAGDQFRPASLLGNLHQLEQGGADAAAHACWTEPGGQSNCDNDSLDGLLTPGGRQPRAAWWAANAYSSGLDSRVASASSAPDLVSIASSGGPGAGLAQVVVARTGPGPRGRLAVRLGLSGLERIPALAGATYARVQTFEIPNSGKTALPALRSVDDRIVTVRDGARLNLPRFGLHQARVVIVSRAAHSPGDWDDAQSLGLRFP